MLPVKPGNRNITSLEPPWAIDAASLQHSHDPNGSAAARTEPEPGSHHRRLRRLPGTRDVKPGGRLRIHAMNRASRGWARRASTVG